MGGGLFSACERPFIEPTPPALTIVEPDFSTVFLDAETMVRVEANSFREVEEVRLNGKPLTFQPSLNAWEGQVTLATGLTPLIFESVDAGGIVGVDTVYALRMPFQFSAGPRLPAPRGGHTATVLNDGSLLVTGGVARAGGELRTESLLLPAGSATFIPLEGLNEPRTGHTATLLPDGRVLILGGSRTDDIRNVSDLVETVEIYDPETRTFTMIPFEGVEPIRRALHTAVQRGNTFIDLYGGRGDIRYTTPRLGTRSDLRTLRFENGLLEPVTNLISAPSIEPIAGHTQTPLRTFAPGAPGFYLVAGSFFDEQGADDVSFQLDFTTANQIFVDEAPRLEPSRTRHAAVMLRDGIVAYFGGTQEAPSDALDETMIYVEEANQFFRLPHAQTPIKRYAHTATKLPSQRILLLGGFTSSGNSLSVSEFFDASLPN